MADDATMIKKRKLKHEHDTDTTLLSLDDDDLQAILLQTRGSDHPNLRLCC